MQNCSLASNLGIYVYATGAISLGLVGLVSGDFATPWQHVELSAPFRTPLAYLIALIELTAGLALLWRRTARTGALTLTVVFSVFTLVWVPRALVANLHDYDARSNVFEQFSLVVGAAVLFASLSPVGSSIARRESLVARLLGLSAISFGVTQIYDFPMTWTPRWIPPGHIFWDYFTTIGFFAAAAAILSGIMAPLASRLLTAEIVSFQLLVWLPKLVAGPHQHFNWAGSALNVALTSAPWVVSDSIRRTANRPPFHMMDSGIPRTAVGVIQANTKPKRHTAVMEVNQTSGQL
jgi:uncharacterized membrane protein YphA (DoxX/SURF4 family)